MRKFLRFMTSIRLAVVLVGWLALSGALSTLVPQGREPEFYAGAYGKLLGILIEESGFSHFFTSLAFILPAFLFFSNLSACAIQRFIREIRRKAGRRHGPDILHLGLMLLVAGAVLSFSGRQEGFVRLAEGDAVELPDGRLMRLADFEYQAYEDGRPRDWTSTVDILRGGETEIQGFPVRVNNPLRLGKLSVYQVSHSVERALLLRDPEGRERTLARGEEAESGGASLFYMADGSAGEGAILRVAEPGKEPAVLTAAPGLAAGPFTVLALRDTELTGLQAVVDPGYGLVLAALLLVTAGTFLTFIRKIGDLKP